jgi:hypothetical protein
MTTTHRITTTAAVLLSLAAASGPTASARPADFVPAGKQVPAGVYGRPDKSMISVSSPSSHAMVAKASVSQATLGTQMPPSGFDWGDAGIGAAGGLVLAMLGLGGGLVISHRRPRRSCHTTALPS